MNTPIRPPRPSLLERADQAFDFAALLRSPAPIAPTVAEPAVPQPEVAPPASQPTPPATRIARAVHPIDAQAMTEAGLLPPNAPVSGLSEEFRLVKRELLLALRGGKGQAAVPHGNIILIASAHSGDGKSWCAVNLAMSLAAERDLEVLLVDGDFAKPGIPQALGLSVTGPGLMDALADPAIAIDDCIIQTDLPQLSVLPAGASSNRDAEHLASAHMAEVLRALTEGHPNRVILFDSPPLLEASPASVLAERAGQTVLVVRADRTSEAALRDAADLVRGCGHVRLLLNGVKFSASGRRFGNYYGKEG